ncbi:hypothetical protein SODG_006882 [Sodalis praecaptivus]
MSTLIRIEEDLLGTREVPADAYYGIHTLRASKNFYISNTRISDIPELVRGMVMVKKPPHWPIKNLRRYRGISPISSPAPVMKFWSGAAAWISFRWMYFRVAPAPPLI